MNAGIPQAQLEEVAASLARHNGATASAEPYRLLSLADLGNLPPLRWLIQDVIRASGFNVLYGPSGIGKSFAASDLALCVATGKPWWGGRTGEPGGVLYWAAEGAHGIRQRALAWCHYHGQAEPGPDRILWTPDSTNLLDTRQFERARATVAKADSPTLLIFDTLARVIPGANESSSQDMGALIYAIDQLRQEANDAAALIIHHTGKDGQRERGSSALEGAADMMLSLRPRDAGMMLAVEKAKDSKPAGPWLLRLEPTLESTVTVPDSGGSGIGPVELLTVRALSEQFTTGEEVAYTKLMAACGISQHPGSKPSASTYNRAVKRLTELGLISRRETDGRSNATFYTLTDAGQDIALSGTVTALSGSGDSTVIQPASLKGAADDSTPGSTNDTGQETLL